MNRRTVIVALLAGLLAVTPLPAQSRLWHRPTTDLWLAPYGGLALASGSPGLHQAIGVHVVWPPGGRLTVAGRYESRWDADGGRSDALTLDLVGRLVGVDQGSFSATAGWTYWREHYVTPGLRALWPFFEPTNGHSVIQGWFDLRYCAPLDDLTGKGFLWTELMVAVVLPIAVLP
jgi:hypothetical protein